MAHRGPQRRALEEYEGMKGLEIVQATYELIRVVQKISVGVYFLICTYMSISDDASLHCSVYLADERSIRFLLGFLYIPPTSPPPVSPLHHGPASREAESAALQSLSPSCSPPPTCAHRLGPPLSGLIVTGPNFATTLVVGAAIERMQIVTTFIPTKMDGERPNQRPASLRDRGIADIRARVHIHVRARALVLLALAVDTATIDNPASLLLVDAVSLVLDATAHRVAGRTALVDDADRLAATLPFLSCSTDLPKPRPPHLTAPIATSCPVLSYLQNDHLFRKRRRRALPLDRRLVLVP